MRLRSLLLVVLLPTAERRRLGRHREPRSELHELLLGVAGVRIAPDVADVFLNYWAVCGRLGAKERVRD